MRRLAGLAVPALLRLAVPALLLVFAGCGTSDPEHDAYMTVIKWTTAITKANFYDACQYEVYDGNYNLTQAELDKTTPGMTERRECAQNWSGAKVDKVVVHPEPTTARKAPKNGYVFRLTVPDAFPPDAYVLVQRDKDGNWRIVSVVP